MLLLSVLTEPDIVLVPVHVYTPLCSGYWALTMCSVDTTWPGVIMSVGLVVISVWLKLVGCDRWNWSSWWGTGDVHITSFWDILSSTHSCSTWIICVLTKKLQNYVRMQLIQNYYLILLSKNLIEQTYFKKIHHFLSYFHKKWVTDTRVTHFN